MAERRANLWRMGQSYFLGITAGDWWRLLRENQFAVDRAYWHRAALISALSLVNSAARRREDRRYRAAIDAVEITDPPLFVLGHWRSGTTHLHNLLAQDDEQFACPNLYQALNPHSFLSTEAVNSRRFAGLVPAKRPTDNVAVSFQTPQEDEFALLLITRLSSYLCSAFPRRQDHYARYMTFRGVPPEEVERWKAGVLWFMKKVTLKYRRALVLKSPGHTARIRLLLEIFPNARFVHISRDPYEVFQSAARFFRVALQQTCLQAPDLDTVEERTLSRYTALYDAFFEERALIPAGQYHELSLEALERDPIGQVRDLYTALGLPGFDALEPKLRQYVDSLSDYRKSEFRPLPPELRGRIAREWRRSFDEWGYPA